jgi:hypothetical protein
MTTAMNEAATALSPKDFMVKYYEFKVQYLTDHFGRMWTRFNALIQKGVRLVGKG